MHEEPSPSPDATSRQIPGRGPIRVLVADDTAEIRLLLRSSLGLNEHFQVIAEARDGVESIREAARHRPDVVILDLAMPLVDGLEAIPAIRRRSPESKIVVLSVFPAERMAAQALEAGADAYLEKTDIHRLVPLLASLYGDLEREAAPEEAAQRPVEAVRPAAEQLGELLQALAHELMSPVTVILRLAETVQSSLDDLPRETIEQCLESITRNASHMADLIESLADAHRVDAGILALDPRPTDMAALVRQTVTDLGSVLDSHTIETSVAEGLVASVDAVRMRQVLTNLLTNAAKFSPEGSRISVEMAERDDMVEISIVDEGAGIPPEALATAFDKFSALAGQRKRGGLGLGLYIARGIARAHGGDLDVRAEPAGGSRFTVTLPRLA